MNDPALPKLLDRILEEDRLLLTTHRTPDPDGLGAELALQALLEWRGKDVIIVNPEPAPKRIRFVDPENRAQDLRHLEDKSVLDERTVVIIDNSDLRRIDDLAAYVREDRSNLIIIDHHDGMQADQKSIFAFPNAGSSCEIIYELLDLAGFSMTPTIAAAVYAGIVADTGNFRYRKTTARTHEIAARLMRFGVNPADMAEKIFENTPLARLILKKKLYSNLVIEQGRLAYFKVRKSDLEALGLTIEDTEGLVNELIEAESILTGLLFTERQPQLTKVSVRSRGSTNMLAAVQKFGGGGHKNACGATLYMDIDAAVKEFIPEALRCLDEN